MSIFNEKQIEAMRTGVYTCRECESRMEFEDKWEDILVCPKCGFSESTDHYGLTDEEYEALYPTREEVLGIENEKEDSSETYEEVYGELDDKC